MCECERKSVRVCKETRLTIRTGSVDDSPPSGAERWERPLPLLGDVPSRSRRGTSKIRTDGHEYPPSSETVTLVPETSV